MRMGKASPWKSQSGTPRWCWQKTRPPSPRMLRNSLSASAQAHFSFPPSVERDTAASLARSQQDSALKSSSAARAITKPAGTGGLSEYLSVHCSWHTQGGILILHPFLPLL